MKKSILTISLALVSILALFYACTKKEGIISQDVEFKSLSLAISQDENFQQLMRNSGTEMQEFVQIINKMAKGKKIEALSEEVKTVIFKQYLRNSVISRSTELRSKLFFKFPKLKSLNNLQLREIFNGARKTFANDDIKTQLNTESEADSLLTVCIKDCDRQCIIELNELEGYFSSELVLIENNNSNCFWHCSDQDAGCYSACGIEYQNAVIALSAIITSVTNEIQNKWFTCDGVCWSKYDNTNR